MNRLAVVVTHPIQYYAPLFRCLTSRRNLDIHVFYTLGDSESSTPFDRGFGQRVQWDIPLLDGYAHTFLPNASSCPGTHHFNGVVSPTLLPRLREWRPAGILIYGWNYDAHLRVLREMHGRVPILFRGDSTLIDDRSSIRALARRIVLSRVYRHIDIALYVGRHNRDYYRWCGVPDHRLVWAPHSVENERFMDPLGSLQSQADSRRKELGLPDGSISILYAGKLEPKKAPDLLLRCFLERQQKNEHLLIAGSGELEADLRRRSEDCPNVHFLGFQNQSQMPIAYRMADVYVQPSRGPGETWGLGVNEAMASSRPVIVSDRVGCAPDLVIPNRTGFTFPHDNVDGLGFALQRLLGDFALRTEMGKEASQLICSWRIEEQAKRIEAALDAVLTRKRV